MLALVLLSFLSSHNILGSLAVRQPFKVANERLRSQRDYADIVFASRPPVSKEGPSSQRLFMNIAVSLVLGVVLAAMAYLISADPKMDESLAIPTVLYCVAVVLLVLHWLLSASSRFSVFRVFPCPQREAGKCQAIAARAIQIVIILCLTPLYLRTAIIPVE